MNASFSLLKFYWKVKLKYLFQRIQKRQIISLELNLSNFGIGGQIGAFV